GGSETGLPCQGACATLPASSIPEFQRVARRGRRRQPGHPMTQRSRATLRVPAGRFMASIRQNIEPNALPDLANLGVLARVLVAACLFAMLIALARAPTLAEFTRELALLASIGLLPLLFGLSVLALAARGLRRLPYGMGIVVVLVVCLAVTTAAHGLQESLSGAPAGPIGRHWLYTVLLVSLLLGYFNLRSRALSPALTEARLQALQ